MFEIFQPKILLFMKQSRPNNNSNSSSHQYGSKMELRRKTTWESSLNKIKTETYKSHNLQPLACPTTEGNSENKIKTETSSLTIYSHWLVPQLREILKIKLRLKLTSLTIYTHHFFLRRRPNIFPHMLLTWS